MKEKTISIIVTLLLLMPQVAHSQLISHRNVVPGGYNFWVYLPPAHPVTDTAKLPVILFLHGRSLCGTDLNRVRRYGPLDALEYGRDIDAVILAPQNPGSSWQPSKLAKVLDWAEKNYPMIDTNRVYVFGMSLGGYGTIDFVGTYPDKVAAAIAMCGGGTIKEYSGLNKVPLWIIHGDADRAVSCNESQKVVNAMEACGAASLLRFNILHGISHSRLGRVFYMRQPYDWLFKHSLADAKRTVNRDYDITVTGIDEAYKDLRTGKHLSVCSYNSASAVTEEKPAVKPSSSAARVAETPAVKSYVIKKGDSLYSIAKSNGTTVDLLCSKNSLKPNSVLKIGRKIKL